VFVSADDRNRSVRAEREGTEWEFREAHRGSGSGFSILGTTGHNTLMATPVVRRMLQGKAWWKNEAFALTKEEQQAGKLYSSCMLKIAVQEKEQLMAQMEVEDKAREAEARIERTITLRARSQLLLAHSPDSWWDQFPDAAPPTALVVLSPASAYALRNCCRRIAKVPAVMRKNEIRKLLKTAEEAWAFVDRRTREGDSAVLTIQRLARQYLARLGIRRLILERWEKRWNENRGFYQYVDVWAQKAQAKKSNYWADEDDAEFVPPPWPISSKEPPLVLTKLCFNPKARTEKTIGSPRSVKRRLENEQRSSDQRLQHEKSVRFHAAEEFDIRDRALAELCALVAVARTIRAAADGAASQCSDEKYQKPPSREDAMMAFMDPTAAKKKREEEEAALKAKEQELLENPPEPILESETECQAPFRIALLPPWPSHRSSVAKPASKAVVQEYHAMQNKYMEEKRAAEREARGEISTEDVGGLPEGFKGTANDLFSMLLETDSPEGEEDGEPQAQSKPPRNHGTQTKGSNRGAKAEDEPESEEEPEEELPELRTNNEQLTAWHDCCTRMLECSSAADALEVILADAPNVLGALGHACQIFENDDAWPHREIFPLPLVVHKLVPVFDPSTFALRSALHKGVFTASGPSCGLRYNNEMDAHAGDLPEGVFSFFDVTSGRWKALIQAVCNPPPPVEFSQAHQQLVDAKLREPQDRTVTIELMEKVLQARIGAGLHERRRPLLTYISNNPNSPYYPSEIAPPFGLIRWLGCPEPNEAEEEKVPNTSEAHQEPNNEEAQNRRRPSAASTLSSQSGAMPTSPRQNEDHQEPQENAAGRTSATASPRPRSGKITEQVATRVPPATRTIEHRCAHGARELLRHIDSVCVDCIADTGRSMMEREQLFAVSGAVTSFASPDCEFYLTRVFLYSSEDMDTASNYRPAADAVSYGVENGGTPPELPARPPPHHLFDYNQDRHLFDEKNVRKLKALLHNGAPEEPRGMVEKPQSDGAQGAQQTAGQPLTSAEDDLAAGGVEPRSDHAGQRQGNEEDEDDEDPEDEADAIELGWAGGHEPQIRVKKTPGRGSTAAPEEEDDEDRPPPVFSFKDYLTNSRYAELRVRGAEVDASDLRRMLPGSLHPLMTSHEEPEAADEQDGEGPTKKKGRRRARKGGAKKKAAKAKNTGAKK